MKKTVSVGLVQINNSFSNQNYLPYSAGILQAYAQKYLSRPAEYVFALPIYKRVPVARAIGQLAGLDIVFFSVYTWNLNLSLEIARRLKRGKNAPVVVFGGPEVPSHGIAGFLKLHRCIDIACHGEGEKAFLGILENFRTREWDAVPNISRLDRKGKLKQGQLGVRTTDLAEIPSPYLEGTFAPLMKANPGENWVALWETNRGCPFSCSYCVWGALTNKKLYARDTRELYRELDWFSANKIEFIFCCDANFGILPRDLDLAKRAAANRRKGGYPAALSVQNTKNSTMSVYNIYKTLSDAKLNKGVSLAMQSANPATLRAIKRENISQGTFQELQEKFSAAGIETFTDVILGLPRETYKSFTDGVSEFISNGQHNRIQFNNLTILTGSEMAEPAYMKKYRITAVDNKLMNIHGSLADRAEVEETQRIVVATASMPKKDWVRSRVFGWMTGLLHFDKLIQIPLIVMNKAAGLSYKELIETLLSGSAGCPVLRGICGSFARKARDIQKGGAEFSASGKWLNIWWQTDELELIKLCTGNKLDDFYSEAEDLLTRAVPPSGAVLKKALPHAFALNRELLKRPFLDDRPVLELPCNIWDFYRSVLGGADAKLAWGTYRYEIDRRSQTWDSWETWCREVIWYGNKRGAYLYPCKRL